MGSGKTSWAIQYMNNSSREIKFIYITPFLKEVERVKQSVKTRIFFDPIHKGNGKLADFKSLIVQEKNIVSTHALFQTADEEIIQLLKASNYILILDEVMNVVEEHKLKKDDINLLVDNQMVIVDKESGKVKWNVDSKYQDTKYEEIKNLSQTDNLFFFENTILFWTFPVAVFNSFKKVYVLTYLFEAQQQKYYYDMYKFEYKYKAVELEIGGNYYLVPHHEKKPYDKAKLKSLIEIYSGGLNSIGDDNYSFSVSWYKKEKNVFLVDKMKKNLSTFFKNNTNTGSKFNMWTCFKAQKSKLRGKGYSGTKNNQCFVAHNARATNDYQHKQSLAYGINRFMNPYEYKFFQTRGVKVDEDLWALSELIQWIWRSQIRTEKPIKIYIPSKRMRRLLIDYLESDK